MPLHLSQESPVDPTPPYGNTPAGISFPTATILAAQSVVGSIVTR